MRPRYARAPVSQPVGVVRLQGVVVVRSTSVKRWLHRGRRQYGAKGGRLPRFAGKPPFLGFDVGGAGVDHHLDELAAADLSDDEPAHAGAPPGDKFVVA